MKWPTIAALCLGLAVVAGCAATRGGGPTHDKAALERLYRTDMDLANDGEPEAMMRLARYYDTGLSVSDRCAGTLAPLCRIGPMARWLSGTVVARDRARAYMWYSVAALNRHRAAPAARQSLIREMSRSEIDEGDRLIAEWLEKHDEATRQRASGTRP